MMGTTEEVAKRIQESLKVSGDQIDLMNLFDNSQINFFEKDTI